MQVLTLHSPPSGKSEVYVAAFSSLAIERTLESLNEMSGDSCLLDFYCNRNCVDSSTHTASSLHPDFCIWHCGGALLFKGEEKPGGVPLSEAINDLKKKVAPGVWDERIFGCLPYLLCYAACGPQVNLFMMQRDTNIPWPVSRQLNMTQVCSMKNIFHADGFFHCSFQCCPGGIWACKSCSYRFHMQALDRVALLNAICRLLPLMAKLSERLPWVALPVGHEIVQGSSRVKVAADHARKIVSPFSLASNTNTNFNILLEVNQLWFVYSADSLLPRIWAFVDTLPMTLSLKKQQV